MKKIIFIVSLFFIYSGCFANETSAQAKLLSTSKQLIIVSTSDWDSTTGQLQRFTRHSTQDTWQPVGKPIPVVLGKRGLGWGNEHHAIIEDNDLAPTKKESDLKTPVGIYKIGQTFGFDETSNMKNYFPLTNTSICVDDVNSTHYNQLIDSTRVPQIDWNSGEKMRTVDQYKIGAMVLYNTPPTKGAGSCIFLHIWKSPSSGTAGCIAMEESNLAETLNWLRPKQKPVIAIIPMPIYNKEKMEWNLPEIA